MTTYDCAEFRDSAAELALGITDGTQRGAAVEHLAHCSSCRALLEDLMQVADLLPRVVPPAEPDVGFEARIMGRLAREGAFGRADAAPDGTEVTAFAAGPAPDDPGAQDAFVTSLRPRARRWLRTLMVAAAVVVVVAATAAIGASARRSGRQAGLLTQSAAVTKLGARVAVVRADDGRSTCQLVAFPAEDGHPARVVVHLDEPGSVSESYAVLAEPASGRPAVRIGTITLVDGQGSLEAAIPAGTGPVNAVQIADGGASVKYRATFASV